jgi:uncharacterized protein YndB with AHSA1/START domain
MASRVAADSPVLSSTTTPPHHAGQADFAHAVDEDPTPIDVLELPPGRGATRTGAFSARLERGRVQDGGMAVDVLTEIVIARPCAEVAAYAGDPSHAPQWYVNIESVEWRTPAPVAVGSRMDFVARFLGRRLAYTYEVVEFVPGERLVMRTAQGPFPMETTYTWRPEDPARTRMTLRNRGEPAGFAKVTAPMMAASMRRANQKDLANLKRILERPR